MCSASYNIYHVTNSHTEGRTENCEDNLYPLVSEWLQFSVAPIQDYSGEGRKHIAMWTVSSMHYMHYKSLEHMSEMSIIF